MSAYAVDLLLLAAIAWPLALALAALRGLTPWARQVAVLPAAVLAGWPAGIAVTLPWVGFGAAFELDAGARWLLAMLIGSWLLAAPGGRPGPLVVTCQYLALGGALGAVLAADLVVFFGFSSLVGYAFYALLAGQGPRTSRRAGRVYLVGIVLADLMLFEALLLAASSSPDLHFRGLAQNLAALPAAPLYAALVTLGFALKAGLWPVHRWLVRAYAAAPRDSAVLIGAVPLALGLLGVTRWLPAGTEGLRATGVALLVGGLLATSYGAFRALRRGAAGALPLGWIAVALAGLVLAAQGLALADPLRWGGLGAAALRPAIAGLGALLAAVAWASAAAAAGGAPPGTDGAALDAWPARLRDRFAAPSAPTLLRWRRASGPGEQPGGRWFGADGRLADLPRVLNDWEARLRRWPVSITLLALLGLAIALIGRFA